GGIARPRREHHDQSGNVREDGLAALAVPDRAAGEVAADGDAQHDGALPLAVRAPADRGRLALDLLHGGPDVVEELDLRTRAQPPYRLADGSPDDVRLRQRCVEAAGDAERPLQAVRRTEHTSLALDLRDHLLRRVGDVLAEDADALVGRHLLVQRAPNRLTERHLLDVVVAVAAPFRGRRWIRDRRRDVHVLEHRA